MARPKLSAEILSFYTCRSPVGLQLLLCFHKSSCETSGDEVLSMLLTEEACRWVSGLDLMKVILVLALTWIELHITSGKHGHTSAFWPLPATDKLTWNSCMNKTFHQCYLDVAKSLKRPSRAQTFRQLCFMSQHRITSCTEEGSTFNLHIPFLNFHLFSFIISLSWLLGENVLLLS